MPGSRDTGQPVQNERVYLLERGSERFNRPCPCRYLDAPCFISDIYTGSACPRVRCRISRWGNGQAKEDSAAISPPVDKESK